MMLRLIDTKTYEGKQALEAMARLIHHNDFKVFWAKVLSEKQRLERVGCKERDEVLMRWNQGALQALNEIDDALTNARKYA